jgi:NAD+ synthase
METLELPPLDCATTTRTIEKFIRKTVGSAKKEGVVIGLSGGIDSAVVTALSVRALGPEQVLNLRLFEYDSRRSDDARDALELSELLGTELIDVDISDLVETVSKGLPFVASRIVMGNAKARVRMLLLYAFANHRDLLVAGTGDKSEDLIGYFTKYGDGGVDFLPIAHLYKTQFRALGKFLGLPDRVVDKPSSPNLWPNHKATDEIPLDYPILDRVLYGLVDSNLSAKEVSQRTRVTVKTTKKVLDLLKTSAHKRNTPLAVEAWSA